MDAAATHLSVIRLWPDAGGSDHEPASGTVEAILDAAFELFLEFGFRKTSIEDVARRAGISRVTIYRHYSGKPDLFQAVVLRDLQQMLQEIDAELSALPVEDVLVEALVQVLRRARQRPLLRRLLETEREWLVIHATLDAGDSLDRTIAIAAHFLRQPRFAALFDDTRIETMAELLVRLLQSALLTPGGELGARHDESLRAFFRVAIEPLLQARHEHE